MPTRPATGSDQVGGAVGGRRRAHSYFQSGSSGCFRSQSGRRLRTTGKRREVVGAAAARSSPTRASRRPTDRRRPAAPRRSERDDVPHEEQRSPAAWKSDAERREQVPAARSRGRRRRCRCGAACRGCRRCAAAPKVRLKPMTNSQKCQLAEPLVEQPPGHLREPVVDRGEDGEQQAADQHVVEVRDDEVRVGELPVERRRPPASRRSGRRTRNWNRKRGAEQHRRGEADLAAPHRADPVEDLDAGRHGDEHRRDGEEGVAPPGVMPTVNMWCAHTPRLMKPIATVAATITG